MRLLLPLCLLLSLGCERIVYRSLPVLQDATAAYYLAPTTEGRAVSAANLVGYGYRAGAAGALALMHGDEVLYHLVIDGEQTVGYRIVADEERGKIELRELSCAAAVELWPVLGQCPPALGADRYRVLWSGALR